ncbi:ABC transporter ATP-binding protein [Acholeplasma equirhinis]|uniref:ABC transporter ATP-binding protein n=1 Tax=Acholeplasma equirhinis TaxID=555393 RepID=UPI00197AD79E|nr:ABC transporter ATP-binding protein [Acholeplasma equirhinis]MBN3490151.1 ABC transporter ATP-binding protein [Acholeplasma equirhinis]
MHGSHPGRGGEKAKFNPRSFKKILKYMDKYAVGLVFSIILAIGSAVTTIVGPDRVSELLNEIMGSMMTGINMDTVTNMALGILILYILSATFGYLQQFIMATITQKTANRLRSDMDNKLYRLPLAYFDKNQKGDILSRVTNDVDTIAQSLSQSIANLFSSIILFIGLLIMMFISNWVLALVTIFSSMIGMIFLPMIVKKSQKFFRSNQQLLGKLNGQIEEVYTNHNVVKAFNGTESERAIFNDTNNLLRKSVWRSQFLSGLMAPVMIFVGNLSYILIFVVGSILYLNGFTVVTIGTLASFVIYARLFSTPLQTFAQAMTGMQQASAAADRVFTVLEEPEMRDETNLETNIDNVQGNIEFKDVKFGYFADKEIIHGFSASIKKGQKVAIVGPTGAGKTTIVNLLMKFYDVNQGDIVIDGVSIHDMKRESIHNLFDMILQDTWLFKGTLRENLVYNKENVSDKELDRVCETVGLKHFVQALPNGYDTFLDESAQLSEGQKQQITIARAMIKDAPLLILDEATSSVDTRTELLIQRAMDELTVGRTSFVIAHRLSTIRNADIILVLKDGDIIEQGNHETLLAKNGFYAELYNSQFQNV